MNYPAAVSFLVLLLLKSTAVAQSNQEEPTLLIESGTPTRPDQEQGFHYEESTGWTIATNGVVVTYGDIHLTADSIRLQEDSGQVVAEGDVRLSQRAALWTGHRLSYNYKTDQLESGPFRAGLAPLYVAGESLSTAGTNGVYIARDGFVTTDRTADPRSRIQTREIEIAPDRYVKARHAVLFVSDVPLFYFPYYRRSLQARAPRVSFTPGYRSAFGPYLLSSYNWFWSDQWNGAFMLDYRVERGFGVGPDLDFDLGRFGKGHASFYYAHDDDPGETADGAPINPDRHRFSVSYLARPVTNLTAVVVANGLSDELIRRDFFETEHRANPQPKSFLEVNQAWPNFSLDLLAQPQLNDFFQTVERLPDVRLTGLRQQLGVSPFYYEGESSVGYFRFQPAGPARAEYAALRADSFHQLLLPRTFFGWLNVTPRVGGRFTYYSENDGSGAKLSEVDRLVFNTGAEVSTKASQIWPGVKSDFWDIDELRHILQPSVNYAFVPSPSAAPRELPQFDTEIPSFRLLPIDYPDYNAIDAIDSQNVFRLGLRNKLQTKREDGIDNLLHWALYTDWRVNPRRGQSTFADLYSDLDLKPRSWLVLNSETRLDLEDGTWRLANHSLTLQPNTVWSVRLGHRYFQGAPGFGAGAGAEADAQNNLLYSSIHYRFNENWGARVSHHFEAQDGVMEEQYYTVYRDFRSWTAALTFRVRDNRSGEDDYSIALTLSLKAFPRYPLGNDRDDPSYLLGG